MSRPQVVLRFVQAVGLLLLSLFAATRSSALRSSPQLDVDIGPLGMEPHSVFARSVETSEQEAARRACEEKVRAARQEPEMPGTPSLDLNREEILFETKAEPVLFVRAPQYKDSEPVNDQVQIYRKWLTDVNHPGGVLAQLKDHFTLMPRDGRDVVLKEGYLYADDPETARSLVREVTAQQLFGHDRIWIQRGEQTFHAERKNGKYFFTDGPNKGDLVHLLLFDRIGSGEPSGEVLQRDLRSLRYRLHFTRMQVQHLSEQHIVALLQYGNRWVPSLLKSEGAHLDLECEIADAATEKQVNIERQTNERRQRVVQILRKSMLAEIVEGLPFDEPRHEFGMQFDGRLRANFRHAYFTGKRHYDFTSDTYDVYDAAGRPLVPQVCVDFITDTFERAAGTWYRPRGQPPGKTQGTFDFGTEIDKPWLRRAPDFVRYAEQHSELFNVLDVSDDDQVPLGQRDSLISYLAGHTRDYQPGDVMIIRGHTPWDPRTMHYHSFFVYESDPLSGIPIALVGNAGRPSLRVWQTESHRTPERAIHHRLRPSIEWLETIFKDQLAQVDDVPMTLTPRGVVD
ncbi:MAG TPA: hypothetical protein VL137_06230 [Polyangiaceae bacterium]|jgi:hypothetical protein|nr:hypothetical protein [Polyangiaceae bacterium]